MRAGIRGYVLNLGGSEVLVHAEGSPEAHERFLELLYREKPPPAIIEGVEVEDAPLEGHESFTIRPSGNQVTVRSQIPPDLGICPYCRREILDPSDRRYRYPWNSCAWCGPRFSMMYRIPYDRENTSMNRYPLCRDCLREYGDLSNVRRYHAQGISCSVCGPKTILRGPHGEPLDVRDPVAEAVRLLEEGHVLAIKGLGGYHIAGDPYSDVVVERIRRIKNRPRQPLALMARDCSVVEEVSEATSDDCRLLESPERPILLVGKKSPEPLSPLIAPLLDSYGIMLPYTGLQVLLLEDYRPGILVMTSGNRHGLPMCRSLDCLLDQLEGDIDYILDHDREIVHRVDDSLVRRTLGKPVLLRRSRGYAPRWIHAPRRVGEHAALGAELQTGGAVSFDDKIVPTQYIGDLDEPGQVGELEEEIEWLLNQYRLKPHYIVVDAHPAYTSRRIAPLIAERYGSEILEAYHHHMHALSLIAEARLDPRECHPTLALDGTGYGVDGRIWGGEALLVEGDSFERIAHISYYPLPGGDAAAKKPLRITVGILSRKYGLEETLGILERRGLLGNAISVAEARIAYLQSRAGQPYFESSSSGRLLDAISALLGLVFERTYEGEPAIVLEAQAKLAGGLYGVAVEDLAGGSGIDPVAAIEYVLDAVEKGGLRAGLEAGVNVMYSIGYILASRLLEECRAPLLLTGGAAVNDYIALGALNAAREHGVGGLVMHRLLPPGDGGISAGQVLFAGLRSR